MSSLGGFCSAGNRSRSAPTVSMVSSTDSVVCDSQTTFSGSRTVTVATSAAVVDELDVLGRLARGALDLLVARVADQQDVVVLAGEPLRLLVHLGDQRAGGVDRAQLPRAAACSCTAGETPWAEKTTMAPSGTSSVSSTKTAPRSVRVSTTCPLCTICLRT